MAASIKMEKKLKDYVNEHMPFIDDLLSDWNIPIHLRFYQAGRLFVEIAVKDSTFGTKEELLKSEAYQVAILPIVNDWYWERYGELTKTPNNHIFSGIVLAYETPILIKVPATTSRVVEEGKLAVLTFPDHFQNSESITDFLQTKFDMGKMNTSQAENFKSNVKEIVALTRSINLDINLATGLNNQTNMLAKGIWSHFEKAINDILTLENECSSIAYWDIHLGIEKAFKVLISEKLENWFMDMT